MVKIVEKVTAFITRPTAAGPELLLFEHPNAGTQIPAGTVEESEAPGEAVLREAEEETGLSPLVIQKYLGSEEHRLPDGQWMVAERTKVYARPDLTSFDWAMLRRGTCVTVGRQANGFSQITYEEFDRVPEPQYVTMSITGWVPDDMLADTSRRHFFHLEYLGLSEDSWTVFTDHHVFTLFWAPLLALPQIIHPQDQWVKVLGQGIPFDQDGVE
jgi:8-oxo-dGTP pyrophosphatase MutT (NUDIX family)